MKHEADKNHFDHQCHHVHFLWASNRDQQIYDMRIVQDNKKLGFQKKSELWKKTLSFETKKPWGLKTSEFFKKTLSFEKNLSLKKTLSLEKIWVLKNVFTSRKNLVFYKGKNYNENKTSNLK